MLIPVLHRGTESGQEQEQTSLAFHGCSPQLEMQYEDRGLGHRRLALQMRLLSGGVEMVLTRSGQSNQDYHLKLIRKIILI